MPAVQRISDQLERMVIADDVASYIGVDRGMVLDSFKKAVADRQEKPFQRPDGRAAARRAHADQRAADASRNCAAEIVAGAAARWRRIATFPSRRIFQAIFALDAGGGRLDFEAVHARLEEEDQHLLAQAVLNDDVRGVARRKSTAAMASMRRIGRASIGARN